MSQSNIRAARPAAGQAAEPSDSTSDGAAGALARAASDLIDDLKVTPLSSTTSVGAVPARNLPRMFGGQVLAQGLRAAEHTRPAGKVVHYAQSNFISPGDPTKPVTYEVEPLQDGGSFSLRLVRAVQDAAGLATLLVSFQKPESWLEHDIPAAPAHPTASDPAMLPTLGAAIKELPGHLPDWWTTGFPLDLRFETQPTALTGGDPRPPSQRFWIRLPLSSPSHAVSASVLAWASDLNLLDVALLPHAASWYGPDKTYGATLNHTMWFHRPFDFDSWLHCVQLNEVAHAGRALCTAQYRDRSGVLVASAAQEGLIRPPR